MSIAASPLFAFDNSYVRELEGLYVPWQATPSSAPRMLALNEELAAELGVDAAALRAPDGVSRATNRLPAASPDLRHGPFVAYVRCGRASVAPPSAG